MKIKRKIIKRKIIKLDKILKETNEFNTDIMNMVKLCNLDIPMIKIYFGINCIVAEVCYMASIEYIEWCFDIKLTLLKEHKKGELYDVYQVCKNPTKR